MRFLIPLFILGLSGLEAAPVFEIHAGDRVLFLGDVLLEREGTYGAIETRMAQEFANVPFTVRNLSWSGETPTGLARASFDPPAKGWERLQAQIAEVKPTVVFLGFGMAAALQELTDGVGPANYGRPKPDEPIQPDQRANDLGLNRDPARYGPEPMTARRFQAELEHLLEVLKKEEGVRLVLLSPLTPQDLRSTRPDLPDPTLLTTLIAGYSHAIEEAAQRQGARYVSLAGLQAESVNEIHLTEQGYASLGAYVADQLGWTHSAPPAPALQEAIVRKNRLFFYQFRPENYTYLFGFRKHEQGQNAGEIPAFDPLIARAEAAIQELKQHPGAAAPVAKTPEPPAKVEPAARPTFDVQEGYQIELWATNPLLEKPTQINWDSDGRLWIASSSTYPQVNPEDVAATLAGQASGDKDAPAAANDRILILEDTDRDGRADKSTVFAEGLLIPTAVAPFRNSQGQWSCYVGQSTEILELTDTDGDGKADRRRIVLSGFGTEDTHHLVHTMKWGPGGSLDFDQSVYIHSHLETPWGMVRLNSGGVLSWFPDTEKVNVRFKGFCNPWGHVWDASGQEFMTDGAGSEGIAWGISGAMYFTYENGRKICPSVSPGSYPKFCSLEIIRSPHFPDDWQGSFITCDFRAHRVVHFGVTDLALDPVQPRSGYITSELPDLVRTSDLSFRPIDVRLGPDGALYIADWSNPVINHGEVDFRDPRRDHHQGRIWRVTRKGEPLVEWQKIEASPKMRFAAPAPPSAWELEQTALCLTISLQNVRSAPASNELLPAATPLPLEKVLANVKAGWTQPEVYQHDPGNEGAIGIALMQLDPLAHAATGESGTAAGRLAQQVLEAVVSDPNPRRRLQAMRDLARDGGWLDGGRRAAQAAQIVLLAALKCPPNDPYYEYAAWLSINDLAGSWSQAVLAGDWAVDSPTREQELEYALNALDPALASSLLSKVLQGRTLPADGSGPWIELIGKAGGVNELQQLLATLTAGQLNPAAATRALDALREATRVRNLRPSGATESIEDFLTGREPAVAAAAAEVIGLWKTPHALDLLRSATEAGHPLEVRLAALHGLRALGGKGAIESLGSLADAEDLAIARVAVVELVGLQPNSSLKALDVIRRLPQEQDRLEIWRAILSQKGVVKDLADLFTKGDLAGREPSPMLALLLRAARELGKPGDALVKVLSNRFGLPMDDQAATANFPELASRAKKDGDPAKGEEIFRRAQLACTTCHAIGGAGGKVGPELTSLGASAPLDYIIESVLAPAAKVKEGFNAVNLTLQDGTSAVGIQSHETAQEVFLRNAVGQETAVPKAKIVGRENIGSIMPAGLTAALEDRERLNLYAFLAQLGRPGAYDASKGTVARYWALQADLAATREWPPAGALPGYTLVDGRLTREQLQPTLAMLAPQPQVYASARFQLPKAGPAAIHLTGASGGTLDGQALKFEQGIATIPLAAGEHTLCVPVDPANPPEVLRAEIPEARFLGN